MAPPVVSRQLLYYLPPLTVPSQVFLPVYWPAKAAIGLAPEAKRLARAVPNTLTAKRLDLVVSIAVPLRERDRRRQSNV